MAWTDTTSTEESWKASITGATTWDNGATVWDVFGNVETTQWDVPSENWADTSSASESWVDV